MKEVDYLGYHLSPEWVKPQKRLTDAICTFPRPSTRKDLKRFLGLTSYYREFIPMFAEISSPLNNLTSEKVAFNWDEKCESAFTRLKDLLCSYPDLSFPRIGEPFIVEVDGSDNAVGGALLQRDWNGHERPVAYYSNNLQPAQRKWSAHTKESYALILALRHWRVYLCGLNFLIRTDHNPLIQLRKTKDPRGTFPRWLTEVEEYSFEIEYKPGKLNVVPDALSRCVNKCMKLPADDLDEKSYAVFTTGDNIMQQLKYEQGNDPVIRDVTDKLLRGIKIETGRLRHV